MHDTARLLATAAIAAAAMLAGACDVSVNDGRVSVDVVTGVAEREERRSYAIGPDGQLEIENRNGAVEVGAWDGPGVEVTITTNSMASFVETWDHGEGIDFMIARWTADFDDQDNFTHGLFHSRTGLLRSYFSAPEVDTVCEEARAERRAPALNTLREERDL